MASGDVTGTLDTEGVYGNLVKPTTADTNGANVDTEGAIGTLGKAAPGPVAATVVDTTGVAMGSTPASGWKPTNTDVHGTRETVLGTIEDVQPKRTTPDARGLPVTILDTTWTNNKVSPDAVDTYDSNSQTWSGAVIPDPSNVTVSGTLETTSIGAVPAGTKTVPAAPAAPTATAGDRSITVSWTHVADPGSDAKVTEYVIESDTGGHIYAGANVTSAVFQNVVGGRSYKFRVLAVNRNGEGPWSPFSATGVAAYNTDEHEQGRSPGALSNPVYTSTGYLPGTYGAPSAPGQPTVTAQGTAGEATVTWTASTPQPSGGYDVTASTGQTVHVAGNVTTATLTGLTVGNVITVTVKADGSLQNATSVASASYTVV